MTMSVDTKAIRARADGSTVGPWRVQTAACEHGDDEHSAIKGGGALVTDCVANENDAAFIAHARADIPALCDEVERLRSEVAELRALGVSLHKSAAMGRDAERAVVVAWLREHTNSEDACMFASWIERGEHRREETK